MTDDESKTLALIGLTKAELQERVIARLCSELTTTKTYDEDGDECVIESSLRRDLMKAVREAIDAKVSAVAEEHVVPNVGKLIETVTLQKTNDWGEKKGEAVTFVEYLTKRGEAYLQEKVDYKGQVSSDRYGHNEQTRIVHLVDKHLNHSIECAMQGAAKTVNAALAEGVATTIKLHLAELSKNLVLKVVKTR